MALATAPLYNSAMHAPSHLSLSQSAFAALMETDPTQKCVATQALRQAFANGQLARNAEDAQHVVAISHPGRPNKPALVEPRQVPRSSLGAIEGRAALIHALCHIEFNAINLALDCCYRFPQLPDEFHQGWLQVADEEALHFRLLRGRLNDLGFDYGDFLAHDGLWQMAMKTAHDPLVRMALVPRVLEARGLDATPPIIEKLKKHDDAKTVAVLEIIERDEVGHVRLGDTWFRRLCAQRGLHAEETFAELSAAFDAPRPIPPMNRKARLAAGFTEQELAQWEHAEAKKD